MRSVLITSIALLAITLPALANGPGFTVPPPMMWIATPCAEWNCVMAELAVSNGDRDIIAMPTTSSEYPWIVLKKVPAGIVQLPDDPLWSVEHFTIVGDGMRHFMAISLNRSPVMLTTTGGALLVASMTHAPKPRAVRH